MLNRREDKKIFSLVFLMLVLLLLTLPLAMTFNDLLTKFIEGNGFYKTIQKYLVPAEAKFIGAILIPAGFKFVVNPEGFTVNGLYMRFTWNCIGWQSFILLAITFFFGFSKRYSVWSWVEALVFGILGTFWINIVRMVFIVILAVDMQPAFRIVFHDYLAVIVSISWLFFFWWFVYSFVLETKEAS